MGGGGTGSAADDLPRFFMEWLKNNRDCISAEDLRSIRLRRSTIEAAAARLGGGRQGTMQLLKLILTWVQNHHLQKKRPRVGAMDQEALPAGGQLPSPGANPGYEFPAETGCEDAGGGAGGRRQEPAVPAAEGAQAERRRNPRPHRAPQMYLSMDVPVFLLADRSVATKTRLFFHGWFQKEAETHLPELKTGDGISIPIEDIGTSQVWSMRYRFWPNNKSRMYLLENTGDFVRSNELQEGDFIVLYSDVKSGKYLIRGVKVRAQQDLAKHKNASPEKGGASDVKAGGEDGGCKEKPPHGVRRSRQEAASMNQMAVSI
ncbi:unnamed protein product [Triticum turgidum subsp. durum]|uniref:TF-B3 domain-containing protein n=1 Tax=Triticum turgidum subsp. durum TaxID=4567 RepID=A0A9R0VQB9_TRITD|nr:unnamed protein product [Triticum turgidum subsp. durum]